MKMRRIKFVWGAARVIRGHWYLGLFGFYDRTEGGHDDGIAISVRGLVGWLASAAVVAYLVGAAAMFWFWQRNPYSVLTLTDALLRPVRGAVVHDKQGQAFIAQGTDALRAKRWSEGVSLLRQGLAYHPHDFPARLLLAQFYVASNQRPAALTVLQEGLDQEFPGRTYCQTLLDVAEQGEDYHSSVQLCERYLPVLTGDTALSDRRWLRSRQMAALLAAKHYPEALALADAEGPGDITSEGRALALLGLGRNAEAAKFLAEWRALPGADVHQVLRLQVRVWREARQFDAMDRGLVELRALSPTDPRPLVYGVVQQAIAGRDDTAKAAFEEYFFHFGGSAQHLLLLAEPLAEIGQLALLERCVAAAADRGYALQPFRALLAQAQVGRGEWIAARSTLAAMPPPVGRGAAQDALWRDWMQRLVDAASLPGDVATVTLLEFLRSRPWPMKVFHTTIEALRYAGRWETARDVIALAERAFPASEWLQTQQEEVTRAIAAAQTKAPATSVVARRLPVEAVFFEQLEARLRDAQWTDAARLIRDARNARTELAWVASRDGELRFAQVRVSLGQGDMPTMLAAAGLYLNGDSDRSQRVLELGRTAVAKGDRDAAIALAKEVLRRSPDFPPAQQLLNVWQPRPAPRR